MTEDSLDVSFFNCSFWLTNILRPSLLFATSSPLSPVYSYGAYATLPFFTLDSIISRDYTSLLLEITFHHYERLHFIVVRDSKSMLREIPNQCYERLSISIIQPAVYIYRRYDLTEDSLDVSLFNCSFWLTNILRPSLLFATSSLLSPVYSYGAYATFPFFTVDSIISRDYTSSFREITLHCYERLHFIVMRDYTSMFREIPNQCYERLHFIVMRDYTSMFREIKYFNYTTRRLYLP